MEDRSSLEKEFERLDGSNSWGLLYHKIRMDSQRNNFTIKEARRVENRGKNRYRDVSPWDHSRVAIGRGTGGRETDGSDYINASFVQSSAVGRRYICTQGPLANTCGQFWQMVWEQNTKAVIMLNKVIEKNMRKCEQYFPVGSDFGGPDYMEFEDVGLRVDYLGEEDAGFYTARHLQLRNIQTKESHHVLHLHYTTWPDFGVPQSPAAFLQFLEAARASGCLGPSYIASDTAPDTHPNNAAHTHYNKAGTCDNDVQDTHANDSVDTHNNDSAGTQDNETEDTQDNETEDTQDNDARNTHDIDTEDIHNNESADTQDNDTEGMPNCIACGPPVVHCSAGIGRSGTFCLVDSCLLKIASAGEMDSVDMESMLLEMREYRMGLIQTPDQLRFSYLVIIQGGRSILGKSPVPSAAALHDKAATTSAASTSSNKPPTRPMPAALSGLLPDLIPDHAHQQSSVDEDAPVGETQGEDRESKKRRGSDSPERELRRRARQARQQAMREKVEGMRKRQKQSEKWVSVKRSLIHGGAAFAVVITAALVYRYATATAAT